MNIIYQAVEPYNDIVITVDTLFSDLPFDSIKFIKMVVSIESEFDFEFDDEMLLITKFPTIRSMVEYVEAKVTTNPENA